MQLKDFVTKKEEYMTMRSRLGELENEKSELRTQWKQIRDLFLQKLSESYALVSYIQGTCSHPLTISFKELSAEGDISYKACVCCGDKTACAPEIFEKSNNLEIKETLTSEELGYLLGWIKKRFGELLELNPNISLEEAKVIIEGELPEVEASIKEKSKVRARGKI